MSDSATASLRSLIALTLDEFAAELDALYREKARPTRDKSRQAIGQVASLPGVRTTADFTPETVHVWVRGMKDKALSAETIRGLLRSFSAACNYAVKRGYLDANPVLSQRHWISHNYEPKPTRLRPDDLTADEVSRVLGHLLAESRTWEGHRLFALVATVVYGGLRRSEALGLRVDGCDLGGLKLRLEDVRKFRRVRPIPAKLAEILGDWLGHTHSEWVFPGVRLIGPWTGGCPAAKAVTHVRLAGEAAGVNGLCLRRLMEFHLAQPGRVSLPFFETLQAPRRTYSGPPSGDPWSKRNAGSVEKSATIAPAPECPELLRLIDERHPPMVRGKPIGKRLKRAEFIILKAMVKAGCLNGARLTEAELSAASGYKCPLRTLQDLRYVPPFGDVLDFPGMKGRGGYGFKIG